LSPRDDGGYLRTGLKLSSYTPKGTARRAPTVSIDRHCEARFVPKQSNDLRSILNTRLLHKVRNDKKKVRNDVHVNSKFKIFRDFFDANAGDAIQI
jgi:hypothetical protein